MTNCLVWWSLVAVSLTLVLHIHHAHTANSTQNQINGAPQSAPPNSSIGDLIDNNLQNLLTESTPTRYDTIGNDANKEVIDYDDETLESLNFVQTLTLLDGLFQVNSMLAKHHNNDELYDYLSDLNKQYPDVTRLYSIGRSVKGRDLWVLELTESPGQHKKLKPEFRYVANIHGNEVVGREMLLHLARLLLENYKAAQDDSASEQSKANGPKFVKKLLRDTRIHLMPSLNPDGYDQSVVGCVYEKQSQKGRVNANNIDLNRNFPDMTLGTQIDASTQPETRAFIEWSHNEPFVLSAILHGGSLVASIPYDGSRGLNITKDMKVHSPDDDVFRYLASVYSKAHKTMWNGTDCYDRCDTNYHKGDVFPNGITVGAEWFPLYGGAQDWIYNNTNEFDITLELGCNQYPEAKDLPQYWQYNKKALLSFIRESHRGIKGIVEDENNKPLSDVTVHVGDRDHDIQTNSYGEYYRLLLPGTYEVTFSRPDFVPQKATIVIGHHGMAQVLNIIMQSIVLHEEPAKEGGSSTGTSNDDHSIVVATLIMSIITVTMLLLMAGAYVIQRRRLTGSQSLSVEMQPRSASTGISLSDKNAGSASLAGSSNHPHLSA